MKILHCCLAAVYIDNYGYQENILPKMHKLQGHEVMIVASTETFIDNMNLGYVKASSYYTEYNVPIHRLPYINWLPHFISKKLRIYSGFSTILNKFQPEIIFLHDVQFLSIKEVVRYAKKNPTTTIYADGHTDFINSARNWISKNILHKIIYKHCAKSIEPHIRKFYGVLPVRIDFFKNVYEIDPDKVELLMMGGDLTEIEFDRAKEIKTAIRKQLDFGDSDFIIITGGKIDHQKNVHFLMEAINEIANPKIKLIVFGNISEQLRLQFEQLSKSDFISYIGWKDFKELSNYFLASDLAFFPGTHSVLWEQSASLGLPGVFKKWEGMDHMDIGGNCLFLENITTENIKKTILDINNNPELYQKMKTIAVKVGVKKFSYYEIAKSAIEQ